MSKTLVGLCTFGLVKFTELTINSIIDTTEHKIDFFAVVGKPGDLETINLLKSLGIAYVSHDINYGFPKSLNDIYDYAWKYNDYDNLIIVGNDIAAYPYAIDSLIEMADTSDNEVISALQYDVRDLTREFPETRRFFSGSNYVIEDFSYRPWERFTNYSKEFTVSPMALYDIQNMCLYKRSVFEKIGYTDVNFFPAYYVDNDYARRIVDAGMKHCSLTNARFFHFWSRVLKQGSGGSNGHYFENNRKYYINKWGDDFGKETKSPELGIFTRDDENEIINKWR